MRRRAADPWQAARAEVRPRRLPIRSPRDCGLALHRALAALAVLLVVPALVTVAACAGTRSSTEKAATTPAGRPPEAGEVRLVVSRDFGATVLRDVVVPVAGKLDVLRLLAENAQVETGYGGSFVKSVDGLESSFGASADAEDWFYWVDGVMADVGSDAWKLRGGESVWWDYHRWADAMFVPQALAAFPRPYEEAPLAVAASQDVGGLAEWAAANGLRLEARQSLEAQPGGGLVLATASQAAATPWLTELLSRERSGLALVSIGPSVLTALTPSGEAGPELQAAAVPAPNGDAPERPFLVVLGRSVEDLSACLERLAPENLTARVGLALIDGEPAGLPWETR